MYVEYLGVEYKLYSIGWSELFQSYLMCLSDKTEAECGLSKNIFLTDQGVMLVEPAKRYKSPLYKVLTKESND